MGETLLVNVSPLETRVALIDGGVTQSLHIERSAGLARPGTLYVGKVVRIVPGVDAAFIDIGQPRHGFLHASDTQQGQLPRAGEELLVQVDKEPLGSKGARLRTSVALSSRCLVFRPGNDHIGISKRIEDDAQRSRLRSQLDSLVAQLASPVEGGYILRTAAAEATVSILQAELELLHSQWVEIEARMTQVDAPALVYQDQTLLQRSIRDLARADLERIVVDDEAASELLQVFCQHSAPELSELIEWDNAPALFQRYGVEAAIEAALLPRVTLSSGADLVINVTEAMTTVDVNTGSRSQGKSAEQTAFETNLEAARVVAQQLRLRNQGGIVVVDFIDMGDNEQRKQVRVALEEALGADTAQCVLGDIDQFGLLAMTRERSRQSLQQLLCAPCDTCSGLGLVRSVQSLCYDIFRQIPAHATAGQADILEVSASQEVVDCLAGDLSAQVAELEYSIGKSLRLSINPRYSREQFDIILLQ